MNKKIKMKFGYYFINTGKKGKGYKIVYGRVFEYEGYIFGLEKKKDGYTLTHLKSGALVDWYQYLREVPEQIDIVITKLKGVWAGLCAQESENFKKVLHSHHRSYLPYQNTDWGLVG